VGGTKKKPGTRNLGPVSDCTGIGSSLALPAPGARSPGDPRTFLEYVMNKFFCVWFLMLALIQPLDSWAMQPLITEDASTQGSEKHQIEWSLASERQGSGRTRKAAMTYTLGLTGVLDAFVSTARLRNEGPALSAQGWAPWSLGAKWRFLELESVGTSLALIPMMRLPVSSLREQQGWGTGRLSGELALVVSREMPWGEVHFNLASGRERYRPGIGQADQTACSLSVAPVWRLDQDWTLAADLGVEQTRSVDGKARTRWVEWGVVRSLGPDNELALGMTRSAHLQGQGTSSRTLTAGWTWRF
jgi:hypothetical protein